MKYILFAICLYFFQSASFAGAEMKMLLVQDTESKNMNIPVCNFEYHQECSIRFNDLDKLISNPYFFEMIIRADASVNIEFSEGIYRLNKALNIVWPANSAAHSLSITASGNVVISGAQKISKFYPVDTRSDVRFQPGLDKKVFAAVLKNILPDTAPVREKGFGWPTRPVTTELFIDNKPMTLARWPNKGFSKIIRSRLIPTADKTHFSAEGQRLSRWLKEPFMNAFAYWQYDWASETLPVKKIDVVNGMIELGGKGALYGIVGGQRIFIENAISELDDYSE